MMNQIHDLGEQIAKQKQQCRYYDEEIIRNINKKEEYQKVTKEYLKKIADNSQKIEDLRKELDNAQKAQIAVLSQI